METDYQKPWFEMGKHNEPRNLSQHTEQQRRASRNLAETSNPETPKGIFYSTRFRCPSWITTSEAATSCNLITELSENQNLPRYLDKELMMLQHFRFPEMFLRKSKNAYISFITPQLLDLILETKPRVKYSAIDTKIGREGFNTQTKQLRKLFATKLRTSLPQELVDLLQGRVSQTVFMKFYYRPLLEDARNKTLTSLQTLQDELIETVRTKTH